MTLAIDTSQEDYRIALFWPKKIEKEWVVPRTEKKDLLFYLDQFLRQNKVGLKELRAMAVFEGPGSFTGLRAGLAVAQAFGLILKIPLYGFFGKQYQTQPLLLAQKAFLKLKRGTKPTPLRPRYLIKGLS